MAFRTVSVIALLALANCDKSQTRALSERGVNEAEYSALEPSDKLNESFVYIGAALIYLVLLGLSSQIDCDGRYIDCSR